MEELIEQLLLALRGAGLRAHAAYPAKLMTRLKEPMTAVQVTKARAAEAGLGGYLGERESVLYGKQTVYGRALEATVSFRIASPTALGGGRCFREAAKVMDVLLGGISGIEIGEFTQEPCRYDGESDHFVCTIGADIRARMLLEPPAQAEAAVGDFKLKGELL